MPAGLVFFAVLGALTIAVACSSSPTATTTTPPAATSPVAATTPPTSPTSSPSNGPAAGGDLSGTWTGQYSGAYTGTFTLTWTQSGSKLTGTIQLASLGGDVPINGTVNGSTISFGTVGSTEITYSGSVSGDSMSGTYKIKGAGGASSGGPWSATKTA